MIHKITVGLQQKTGQPNFGSVGASCSVEVQLDDDEVTNPELITSRVRQAFTQCRDAIAKELQSHTRSVMEPSEPMGTERQQTRSSSGHERSPSNGRKATRMASEAQIRAMHAIASKGRVSLASELEQGYGVHRPDELTMAQASQMIDSLKQGLTSSPA